VAIKMLALRKSNLAELPQYLQNTLGWSSIGQAALNISQPMFLSKQKYARRITMS